MKKGVDVIVVTIGKYYLEENINGVKVYRIPSRNIYWSYESNLQPKIKKLIWHLKDSYNINMKIFKFLINISDNNEESIKSFNKAIDDALNKKLGKVI